MSLSEKIENAINTVFEAIFRTIAEAIKNVFSPRCLASIMLSLALAAVVFPAGFKSVDEFTILWKGALMIMLVSRIINGIKWKEDEKEENNN